MHAKEKRFATAALVFGWLFGLSAVAAENCGQVVSVQGAVEIQRAGRPDWAPARIDAQVCEGDRLRVGAVSRAALLVGPNALIRVEQNTVLGLRLTAEATEVELQSGAVYSISRFPRRYRIRTPFVNAGVEGTEFLVALQREEAQVAVYEGRVGAEDLVGERGARRSLGSGEVARFAPGAAPSVAVMVNPADAVQWALYYPPLDAQAIGGSIHELPDCERTAVQERARCLTRRAGRLLRLGRVERAERDIQGALALAPDDADATALTAVIRVVKNDKAGALELAQRAVSRDGRSVPALLALSYAQQAHFRLEEALDAATRAAALEPGNSVAQARRAELLLSIGRIQDAEAAANAAVQASPADSRARTVLGFAQLARLDTAAARAQLSQAASLDEADPLPRLGLGLAAIKDGRLAEGRGEIEIAVALDPQNALLRSYLGKAYSDELRDELASGQLERAKQLDRLDPTPWYYNAIRLQAINRPGEALQELQESIERNDNRAVYRSRLLLDQDQAARSASLAHIYSDLGFSELALSEAMRALNTDVRNFAAHRFLAEAYQALPRYEIARVSELLQSQLLQPASAAVLAPRLGDTKIQIPQGAGPITPSFHEFNPLLTRDEHLFSLGTVAGKQDTVGDEALYAYRRGSRTIQFGQFYYETDGYRPNADLRQKLYSIFYQDDISVRTSWQFEARSSQVDTGDVRLQFNPQAFSPSQRRRNDTDTARAGLRYSPAPEATWLASVVAVERTTDERARQLLPGVVIDNTDNTSVRSESGELQYLGRQRIVDVVAGLGTIAQRDSVSSVVVVTPGTLSPRPPIVNAVRSNAEHHNAYLYGLWRLWGATVTTGLAMDDFRDDVRFSQRRYSPKLGVTVPLGTATVVRAAGFRSVKRLFAANQSLQPTQVAGFNQLFDDVNESRSERLGVGLDQRFSRTLFAGIELTQRELEVPILGTGGRLARFEPWHEWAHRAYLSWLVTSNVGAGIEYYYERRDREVPAGTAAGFPLQITTRYAPFTLTYHHPAGLFATLRATAVDQELRFQGSATPGETHFWIADASVGWRLPRRLGTVSIDVLNLFDKEFRYQDTDFLGTPKVPLFQPRRLALLRARLNL